MTRVWARLPTPTWVSGAWGTQTMRETMRGLCAEGFCRWSAQAKRPQGRGIMTESGQDRYLLGRSAASLSIRCFFINPLLLCQLKVCALRQAKRPQGKSSLGCGLKAPTGQGRACADDARTMRGLCAEGSGTLLIILTDTFLVDPLLLCRSVASSSIRCFFVNSKYAHCDRRSAHRARAL